MKIRKVDAYQTTDDQLFNNAEDATMHECGLELERRLHKSPLYADRDGAKVEPDALAEWIMENKDLVKELLR